VGEVETTKQLSARAVLADAAGVPCRPHLQSLNRCTHVIINNKRDDSHFHAPTVAVNMARLASFNI